MITFPQADPISGGCEGDVPCAWEQGWEALQGRLCLCLADTHLVQTPTLAALEMSAKLDCS